MLKKFLKLIIPRYILLLVKKKYEDFLLNKYKNLDTYEVFKKIYKKKVWTPESDKNKYNFYSGLGSHLDEFTLPYIDEVINFLKSFKEKKEVLEVGCGDFVISSKIAPHTKRFIAADICNWFVLSSKPFKELIIPSVNFKSSLKYFPNGYPAA